MKVEGTMWSWISQEESVRHLIRSLNNGHIKMDILETGKQFALIIVHSFKMVGNTYYPLKSNDIVSLCNEADDIAREEFTRMVEWFTGLVKELGDN